jgi:hypothetical protein
MLSLHTRCKDVSKGEELLTHFLCCTELRTPSIAKRVLPEGIYMELLFQEGFLQSYNDTSVEKSLIFVH